MYLYCFHPLYTVKPYTKPSSVSSITSLTLNCCTILLYDSETNLKFHHGTMIDSILHLESCRIFSPSFFSKGIFPFFMCLRTVFGDFPCFKAICPTDIFRFFKDFVRDFINLGFYFTLSLNHMIHCQSKLIY